MVKATKPFYSDIHALKITYCNTTSQDLFNFFFCQTSPLFELIAFRNFSITELQLPYVESGIPFGINRKIQI